MENKKAHLLKAAEELFINKGYAATSISDILSATDTSKGNLYYHFENKQALLIAVLTYKCELWIDEWNSLASPSDSATDLLYKYVDLSAMYLIDPLLVTVYDVSRNEQLSDEHITAMNAAMGQQKDVLTGVIQKGIETGEFKAENASDVAEVILSTICGLNAVYDYENQIDELRKQSKMAIDILMKGIGV